MGDALIAISNLDSSIQDHRHKIIGFCYKLRSSLKLICATEVSRTGLADVVGVFSGLCDIQKTELLCEGDGDKSLQEFHSILLLII